VGVGLLPLADLGKRVEIARTFEPDPRHRATYDALFREFLEAYRRNQGIFRRLNPRA
jgi:xylulokinase